jgi:hypothetical protein
MIGGSTQMKGSLSTNIIKPVPTYFTVDQIKYFARPKKGLGEIVNDWRSDNWKKRVKHQLTPIEKAAKYNIPTFYGSLYLRKIKANGLILEYGMQLVVLNITRLEL